MEFSDYIICEFLPCFWVENKRVFHRFVFYNPNTPKNRARSLIFSYYRIITPPKHRYLGEKSLDDLIQTVAA